MKKALLIFILILIASLVNADTLYLKDGRQIEGEIIGENDEVVGIKMMGSITVSYKKSNILSIEKSSEKKGSGSISQSAKYDIIKEESSEHKALTGSLSSYSSQELAKLPLVLRKKYRIVVPKGLSEGAVKNIVRKMVDRELENNNNIDEMVIFIYDDKRDVDSFYTEGKAIWAVNGALGNVSPQIASSDDKSTHRINFHLKARESVSGKPTDRELEIYYAHHKALWEDATIPEDVVDANTAKKFGITPNEVDRIYKKVSIWKLKQR